MGIFNLLKIAKVSSHAPSARRRKVVRRGEGAVPDLEQGDGGQRFGPRQVERKVQGDGEDRGRTGGGDDR